MPESKKRKQEQYTPPPTRSEKQAVRLGSPRWLPVVMVTAWILGLLWMVVWYMVPIGFMESLGAWNVAIGFGLIAIGFVLSTRWR